MSVSNPQYVEGEDSNIERAPMSSWFIEFCLLSDNSRESFLLRLINLDLLLEC